MDGRIRRSDGSGVDFQPETPGSRHSRSSEADHDSPAVDRRHQRRYDGVAHMAG